MIGIACDRCGSQDTTLKNEATFNVCYDRAGCDARRKASPEYFRNEEVLAPIEGHPSVRLHGPRDACNALLNEVGRLRLDLETARAGLIRIREHATMRPDAWFMDEAQAVLDALAPATPLHGTTQNDDADSAKGE